MTNEAQVKFSITAGALHRKYMRDSLEKARFTIMTDLSEYDVHIHETKYLLESEFTFIANTSKENAVIIQEGFCRYFDQLREAMSE